MKRFLPAICGCATVVTAGATEPFDYAAFLGSVRVPADFTIVLAAGTPAASRGSRASTMPAIGARRSAAEESPVGGGSV
jgi:hypothetical protein